MAIPGIIESIYGERETRYDVFPRYEGVRYFDLHRKHLFYGRIDKIGDAVILDDGNLELAPAGSRSTEWAVDFVCDAFKDMRNFYKKRYNSGQLEITTAYGPDLIVKKAYREGDFQYRYDHYINNIYANFVQEYLPRSRRSEKINNFFQFVDMFMQYITRIGAYWPITKTGYILSNHCSPMISGFILALADEQHGTSNNRNIYKYANDPNFPIIAKAAKKFGFMMDINAPWRMVFNIGSGVLTRNTSGELAGAQKYMDEYGVDYDNVFEMYFRKAYKEDWYGGPNGESDIAATMLNLYTAFYEQFSTYTKYVTDSQGENCRKVVTESKVRMAPPALWGPGALKEKSEYWIKILLKLRLVESNTPHTDKNFIFFAKKAVSQYRIFGIDAALKYINDLTKGLPVTKFIKKGSYWQGQGPLEYDKRKMEAERRLQDPNPDSVIYSITSSKGYRK